MKKLLIFAVLLALLCSCAQADTLYRTLEVGSVGDDVKALKVRLYELGYYRTDALNDIFNESAIPVVETFQYVNGLTVTGAADAYTQAVLYSDAAATADGRERRGRYEQRTG